MSALMRAKLQVSHVQKHMDGEGKTTQETVQFHAVCKNSYDETGKDEDNTFARWSPGASLSITIANPDLFGKFAHGDKFYVDFTPTEK